VFNPIQTEMFADRNGIPKGTPPDAAKDRPPEERSDENAENERVPEEMSQQAASPMQPGEIRYKRRKRHRRRKRTKIEKRLIWDLCLGGAVIAIIVLLLIVLSKSAEHLPPPPNLPQQEIPAVQ
jgi:hypothetical protein